MTDAPERLTASDTAYNSSQALAAPMLWIERAFFTWRINRYRSKHSRGFARPAAIEIEAIGSNDAPYGLVAIWEAYGIPSCNGTGLRAITNGRRCWYVTLYVSSNQHWMADMLARSHGWLVQTPPVIDAKRGSSLVAAQRGAWKASGNVTRAKTPFESVMRGIGNAAGTRQAYQQRAMQSPGLRTAKKPACKPSPFWRSWQLFRR